MNTTEDRIAAALTDRYRIERELGAGGMATVYLAEDLKHHRKVAIKVLHAELSAVLGPERFLKEIELTANLQHPHILPLFDSGSADGLLYYVMPYVEGESLRDRLNRDKQLPIADAVRIASEAADALDYAHSRGIVHRDIKPENILLQGGHCLVADFGIALAVQQAGGARMTETGLSLGTPQYMSPEQAMGERDIGPRSDIYSLGAVTYEMLIGEPPFSGPTAQAIVARVVTSEPMSLTAQRKSIPAYVDDAVMTALEKLPADRFSTAGEFATALSVPGALGSRPTTRTNIRDAAAVAPRTRRTFATLCAVTIVSLAAGAWGWVRAERASSPVPTQPWREVVSLPDSVPLLGSMALSPDGSALVFAGGGSDGPQLWIRHANSLAVTPIPGTIGGSFPSFSPDGRRIAFIASNGGMRVVPRDGGAAITVASGLQFVGYFPWSDDEHLIVRVDSGFMRVPVNGGKWQTITTVDTAAGEGGFENVSVLPGDHAIVFTVFMRADSAFPRIAVSDPRTGRHTVLMAGLAARYVSPGYLLVARMDSTLVAVPFDAVHRRITGEPVTLVSGMQTPFGVAKTGRLVYSVGTPIAQTVTVARVRTDGSATLIDSTWAGDFHDVAVSPDGAQVAVSDRELGNKRIQVLDLRTGALSSFTLPNRDGGRYPVFTNDSRAVAFTSAGFGPSGGFVYQATLGSAAQPQLLLRDNTAHLFDPAFSPDGHTLFYVGRSGTTADIFAHTMMGRPTAPDRVVVAAATGSYAPQPSPDGRWLAFLSLTSPGGFEVYVRSVDPSRAERWQISHGGGSSPRWSRDGRQLFYLSRDSLMAVDVSTGAEFAIRSQHALFPTAGFSTASRASYDVLPGNAGFVMLKLRGTQRSALHLVMLDNWQAALADSARSH